MTGTHTFFPTFLPIPHMGAGAFFAFCPAGALGERPIEVLFETKVLEKLQHFEFAVLELGGPSQAGYDLTYLLL